MFNWTVSAMDYTVSQDGAAVHTAEIIAAYQASQAEAPTP